MRRWCSLLLLFLAALPTAAVVLRQSQRLVVIPSDQVIHDDLVVSGGTVQVLGHVAGDLVVAGHMVTVTGPVDGDVMVAGNAIDLNGPVGGSIYAAGNVIHLSSTAGRNVTAAAMLVDVEQGAHIARDLAMAAGEGTMAGVVGRDMRARSGILLLTNTARINRNLQAMTTTRPSPPAR